MRDQLGNVLEQHTYESGSDGRALTSERDSGVNQLTLTYVSDSETHVTDALGRLSKYTYDTINGRKVVTRVEGDCGCGSSNLNTWTYDGQANVTQRSAADGNTTSFTYDPEGTQLALAMDATAVGTRFVVLAISVVYRGCAIPVSRVVLPANTKHAWRREWLRMLRKLRPAIPKGWTVIVLANRGLYAPWLFRRIVKLGWHPFLRINKGGTFRPAGQLLFQPLTSFVPQPGTRWRGRGTAFKTKGSQVECTLLACWEEDYKDPWLILTDLPPEASDAGWYGLRAWIEQGFKIIKRATRLCLVSVFRQGLSTILVALLRHELRPAGRFVAEPWPAVSAWEEEAPPALPRAA